MNFIQNNLFSFWNIFWVFYFGKELLVYLQYIGFWWPKEGSASDNHLFSPENIHSGGWEGLLGELPVPCWHLMPMTSSVRRVDRRGPLWWPCVCAHRSVREAASRHQVSAFLARAPVHWWSITEATFVQDIMWNSRVEGQQFLPLVFISEKNIQWPWASLHYPLLFLMDIIFWWEHGKIIPCKEQFVPSRVEWMEWMLAEGLLMWRLVLIRTSQLWLWLFSPKRCTFLFC